MWVIGLTAHQIRCLPILFSCFFGFYIVFIVSTGLFVYNSCFILQMGNLVAEDDDGDEEEDDDGVWKYIELK